MNEEFNLREELEHVDRDIAAEQVTIDIAAAYARLKENEDYKLVIEGRYVDGESKRVCEFLTMDAHLKDEQEKALTTILGHIRYFKAFTKYLESDGVLAEENKAKLEEYRLQVTAGGN